MRSSLLLRYLPIPLVRKAHIASEQEEFLRIFKEESYEKATLIWNFEMRDILKQQIIFNSDQLIKDIMVFVKRRTMLDEGQLQIPKYERPIQDTIKYRFIEEEVRCG